MNKEGSENKFRKVRMAYYQDKVQTPIFEQTLHLNNQGIASFFRYDYPDYSLELNLKKVSLFCHNGPQLLIEEE